MGIILCALWATPALGANPAPARSAEALSKKGKELFNEGRYAEAIAEYEAAYRQVPAPKYLYNVARAYHRQGNKEKALDYYRRYLTDDPNGPGAGEAREYIADIERELAAEKAARAAAPPVDPTPAPTPAAPTTAPEPALATAGPAPAPPPPAAPEAPPTMLTAFGPKLGIHVSTIEDPDIASDFRSGVVAGGFGTFALSSWLGVELELLYAQKGGVPADGLPLSLHYIEVPALVRPHHRGWFAEVGPYLAFAVSGDTGFDQDLNKIDAGGILGAGYSLSLGGRRLIFEARYEMGFTTIKARDVPKTRTWAFTLGYSFR
jgi:hypothetical protein